MQSTCQGILPCGLETVVMLMSLQSPWLHDYDFGRLSAMVAMAFRVVTTLNLRCTRMEYA